MGASRVECSDRLGAGAYENYVLFADLEAFPAADLRQLLDLRQGYADFLGEGQAWPQRYERDGDTAEHSQETAACVDDHGLIF